MASPSAGPDDLAKAVERKAAELEILQRVSSAINSTLELDEICDIALRTMDELFEFHHAIILLVEPGGERLRVVASRGYEGQAVGGRVRIGTGVIGIVAEKRRLLHVNNLGQQRSYAAAQRRQMVKAGRGAELGDAVPVPGLPNAESQIAIPLLIGDELVGVFSIESAVPQTFDAGDRGLVLIVANQIASAVRNAQLYEERRRATEELKAANESLEARVAERTAALERELRVAQELLSDARSRVEGPLLGDSAAVQALRDAVVREAGRSDPLLLVGPPGAGKEAVARELHTASRRPGAFIFVSCPELRTPLPAESPTMPSASAHAGETVFAAKLELAAGGTMFLESVHELPLEFHQALVARLDDHDRRAAAGERVTPEVRIVASSTVEIGAVPGVPARRGAAPTESRVESLLRRLSARHIRVPSLAERSEDLSALVGYFVPRLARQFGKTIDGVSPESMRRLAAYGWPGNIRELRTVLERAVLVSRGTRLEIDEELLDDRLAVGSYRLVSRLGTGGMGEVWLGRHRLLARPAAVKLIRHDPRPGSARDQLVRRFQREAQVTAELRSPHTVQLYDFGVNDTGSFYYVMELLDGLDLNQIVARFGPQPAERVAVLLRQACRSLAEAHDLGLVHRDIKPANLFVACLGSEYDYLKVLDFGIVKDRPGAEAILITAQGMVPGTPAFMAPETVAGESDVDGRADLYSLACVAYWALTAQLVFAARTPEQMLVHHARTTPVPPSQVCELPIPRAIDEVVLRCLAKNPDDRPASALDLDAALSEIAFDRPWTQERAREWWDLHVPGLRLAGRG
jgi:DNA-binding NtrC family response regulator/putative methionine-R-sulfoxide reductase with GAF domain